MNHARIQRARLAVSVIFLLNGINFSTWVSRMPSITDRVDTSTGETGTALMAIAAGAVLSFPVAGRQIDLRSSRLVTVIGASIVFTAVPLIALAPNYPSLVGAFFLFGVGNGTMDIAMNAQAVEVERHAGRSIMNAFHAFFSTGGLIGAGIGALLAKLGVGQIPHAIGIFIMCVIAFAFAQKWMIPDLTLRRSNEPAPAFSLPPRAIWVLGAIACCSAIGEGAMSNWSALYLTDHLRTTDGFAAIGYAVFSAAMLTGRFSGDRLVTLLGPGRLIRISGLIAGVGLLAATIVDRPWSMLVGYAAVGIGLSVIYPLVFSAAGNHPDLSRGRAVSGTATIGYSGFMAGPPLLGWIAQATSMRAIMVIVCLLCVTASALSSETERHRPPPMHKSRAVLDPATSKR